jgi:hypothetical protein
MNIKFITEKITFSGALNDTTASKELFNQLPIEAELSLWGQEIYFPLEVKLSPQYTTTEVNQGDIAYWPQGRALCVFYGPTPISNTNKPFPASPVVILGKSYFNKEDLKKLKLGEKIKVFKD